MVSNRTKSKIGFTVMGISLIALIVLFGTYFLMGSRAANVDKDPNGTAEAAQDGSSPADDGGIDWNYWQSVNPDVIAGLRCRVPRSTARSCKRTQTIRRSICIMTYTAIGTCTDAPIWTQDAKIPEDSPPPTL